MKNKFKKGYQEALNDIKDRMNAFDKTAMYKNYKVLYDIMVQEIIEMQVKCDNINKKTDGKNR